MPRGPDDRSPKERRQQKRELRLSELRVRKAVPDLFEELVKALDDVTAGRASKRGARATTLARAQEVQAEPGYPTMMRKLRRREQAENPRR